MNLQMELTNRCNLKCVECPNRLMKRERHFMSEEIFDVILADYILDLKYGKNSMLPTIILHKDGEPLLHPNFLELIKRIGNVKPDCKLDIYTNGLLITDDLFYQLSTLPNLIRILISFHFFNFDGSQNDYDKANWIIAQGLMQHYINIEVVMASHVTKYATDEMLDKWKEFWEIGVKTGAYKRLTGIHKNETINPWGGLITEGNLAHFEACPYGDFGHWFIGVTGNVIPCCMDLEEEIIFGNVLKDKKVDIGDRLFSFYENLNKGKIEHDLCHRCLNR